MTTLNIEIVPKRIELLRELLPNMVQQATKVEMAVNLKTAKALGIEVPTVVLVRADEVIE